MDGCRDDDADAQDQAAQHDAQGRVLVHLDFLAQGEGQHLHEHGPHQGQNAQAQETEDRSRLKVAQQIVAVHHLPPRNAKLVCKVLISGYLMLSFLGCAKI